MSGWSASRPNDQAKLQQAYDSKGTYEKPNFGKGYTDPNVKMYVVRQGENCIRIVEPIELEVLGTYFFNVYMHYSVGMNNDMYTCMKSMNWGACGVCENQTSELWDNDPEKAKGLYSIQKRFMWVLDLKNEENPDELLLFSCPKSLSDEILSQSKKPDVDVFTPVDHPTDGMPVYFTKTGKGKEGTKYSGVQLGSNPHPIGEKIANQRKRFEDVIIKPTLEEVRASYNDAAPGTESTYDSDSSEPPTNNMGAAEAARLAKEDENNEAGSTVKFDYSDLDKVQQDNQECFRKNYDDWSNCETCVDKELCSQPWPEKAAKPAKQSKPEKAAKPGKPTGADDEIEAAKQKLKDLIDSRK